MPLRDLCWAKNKDDLTQSTSPSFPSCRNPFLNPGRCRKPLTTVTTVQLSWIDNLLKRKKFKIKIQGLSSSVGKPENESLKVSLAPAFDLFLRPLTTLVHELRVALCSCNDHIHPYPHSLCRRGHHVVQSVMGLYTEGQGGVRALTAKHKSKISCRSNPFQRSAPVTRSASETSAANTSALNRGYSC